MKLKLLLLTFLFVCLNCFSQDRKTIHGKVVFNGMALEKIDVVNLNSKQNSTTNSEGNFTIEANVNDVLFILSKDYYDKKVTLTYSNFDKEVLIVTLQKKPIELDEVTITKTEKISVKVSPTELEMGRFIKQESTPKPQGVYTGEMPYSPDFVKIFKMLFGSKKKKDKPEEAKFTNFKEYALSKFNTNDFFYKKLNLKPEEIDLFMAYCESDLTYQTVMQNEDTLETMEFLTAKNEAFKKLER